MKNRIITFSCSSYVHVYEPNCSLTPAWPYKSHESVKDAKKHLESLGKLNVTKIVHRAKNN
jgi:hypothetical protein